MTKFGFTLSNRGLVTGDSSLDEMMALARLVDADERWDSIWVGDSITAKPRLDALSLMSALAAITDRVALDRDASPPRRFAPPCCWPISWQLLMSFPRAD